MRKKLKVTGYLLGATLAAVCGCVLSGCTTQPGNGYFYVKSTSAGYVVAMDATGNSVLISKPLPLGTATSLCNQLNHDLGTNSNNPN